MIFEVAHPAAIRTESPTVTFNKGSDHRPPGKNARGFTLIYIIFTVAIVSAAVSAVLEVDHLMTRRDKEKELLAIGQEFRVALRRYHENSGQAGPQPPYPRTLNELLEDNRSGGPKRHLRKIFVDPMTGRQAWGTLRVGEMIVGICSTSSEQPIKVDGFSDFEIFFRNSKRYSDWVFTNENMVPDGAGGFRLAQPGACG